MSSEKSESGDILLTELVLLCKEWLKNEIYNTICHYSVMLFGSPVNGRPIRAMQAYLFVPALIAKAPRKLVGGVHSSGELHPPVK